MQGFADMIMRGQHLKHRLTFFPSSKATIDTPSHRGALSRVVHRHVWFIGLQAALNLHSRRGRRPIDCEPVIGNSEIEFDASESNNE